MTATTLAILSITISLMIYLSYEINQQAKTDPGAARLLVFFFICCVYPLVKYLLIVMGMPK